MCILGRAARCSPAGSVNPRRDDPVLIDQGTTAGISKGKTETLKLTAEGNEDIRRANDFILRASICKLLSQQAADKNHGYTKPRLTWEMCKSILGPHHTGWGVDKTTEGLLQYIDTF